ncbi:unnamed protein product [Prorocentrum cordatum]|uniref:Uncharacterized protein n=1 Tax=Prorocentrum cordatum TaxID=2364126 RepID=A0ABN9WXA7_9DINO|nr:unnamed protein product [Polarella glacialis]
MSRYQSRRIKLLQKQLTSVLSTAQRGLEKDEHMGADFATHLPHLPPPSASVGPHFVAGRAPSQHFSSADPDAYYCGCMPMASKFDAAWRARGAAQRPPALEVPS